MTDVARVRDLVEYVLAESGQVVSSDDIAMVLLVLDSHALLRGYEGTPAEFHARVQRAYSDALRKMTGDD